jgi:hypothetical protein
MGGSWIEWFHQESSCGGSDDGKKVSTDLELDEGRRELPWSEVPQIRWPYQVDFPEMWLDCLVVLAVRCDCGDEET